MSEPDVHASLDELLGALDHMRAAPRSAGTVRMIVRRPSVGEREVLREGMVDPVGGLVGDDWSVRGSRSMPDGSAHPDAQITLTNARVLEAVAGREERWAWSGDQFVVDYDLSAENLPPGTHLRLGEVELVITDKSHTGCAKYAERFGADALRFVSHPDRVKFGLRGIYGRVVRGGTVRLGDAIRKAEPLVPMRTGHFVFESGHHGALWLDLERLFLQPAVREQACHDLAECLRKDPPEAVCGPLVEGAFLGLRVAARLGATFVYTTPRLAVDRQGLYPVEYPLPKPLAPELRGRRVAIVNDVVHGGSAVLASLGSLRAAGAEVTGVVCLLRLGKTGEERLREEGVPLVALASQEHDLHPPDDCPQCRAGIPLDDPTA